MATFIMVTFTMAYQKTKNQPEGMSGQSVQPIFKPMNETVKSHVARSAASNGV